MKRRITFTLFLSLVLVLSFFASARTTSAQGTAKRLKVGLVQLGTDNPFWIAQVQGGQEAARRYGFDLVVTSGNGSDVATQVKAFENLINQGVDVISINPLDAKAFGPSLAKAKAANIPVVCLFSPMDGCVSVVGLEETANATMVGQYAVQLLTKKNGSPKGNVAILLGALGQPLTDARSGGFTDVLKQYPDIKIVAQESTGNWEADKATSITQNWLTAYPDLDLIYGESDSLTLPAANVLKRAGKTDIDLLSYDGTDLGLAAVADGTLKNTVALLPQYNGFWNVYAAYLVGAGIKFPAQFLMPGAMVTTDNIKGFQQMATDMDKSITSFPFELPIADLVNEYAVMYPTAAK